jgi:hypothetical protein
MVLARDSFEPAQATQSGERDGPTRRDDRGEVRDYCRVVTRKSAPITLSGLRSDSSINYHRERVLVRRLVLAVRPRLAKFVCCSCGWLLGSPEFVDAQIERQSAADKAEFAKLKAEHDQAVGEAKTKLREKLDAAQSRLQAQGDAAKQKVAAIKRQTDAKIQLLKDQAAKARGDAKTRLERRAEETRADSEARLDKLGKAWQLVKDAEAI